MNKMSEIRSEKSSRNQGYFQRTYIEIAITSDICVYIYIYTMKYTVMAININK